MLKLLSAFFCLQLWAAVPISSAQSTPPGTQTQASLAPGDLVRIAVWRETDLSGDFIVDELGIVTLPLLGRFDVRSIPIPELRDRLIAAYAVQLKNPSVTITPMKRVHVLGEVMKPGLYPADPTITLAGLLALAGGATPTGDLRKIRVMRSGAVLYRRIDASSTLTMSDIKSNDQIFVDRRSWMDRNSGLVVSSAISAATLVLSLLLR